MDSLASHLRPAVANTVNGQQRRSQPPVANEQPNKIIALATISTKGGSSFLCSVRFIIAGNPTHETGINQRNWRDWVGAGPAMHQGPDHLLGRRIIACRPGRRVTGRFIKGSIRAEPQDLDAT